MEYMPEYAESASYDHRAGEWLRLAGTSWFTWPEQGTHDHIQAASEYPKGGVTYASPHKAQKRFLPCAKQNFLFQFVLLSVCLLSCQIM